MTSMRKKEEEFEKKKYITLSGDEEDDFKDEELEKHAFGEHPDDYEYFDAPFGDESYDSKGKKVLFWLVASVLVAGVIAIFCAISSDDIGD